VTNNKILLDSITNKIEKYNKKISQGLRLSESEAEDFSMSVKFYPLLSKQKQLYNDIEYIKANPQDYDSSFLRSNVDEFEALSNTIRQMLYDINNPSVSNFIVEIRAGAGGEEASLFCKDIFSAYTKFILNEKANIEIIELSGADSGGYSTIIFEVNGKSVYDYFKNEGGVHRVQRVPKTESSGRIHTSTISIAILPIVEKSNVQINPADIRTDVYRSSGHGGQSVNTTDSAVRLTHLPSGLVVTCQNTKSQIKNKEMAMKVLLARLEDIASKQSNKSITDLRNKQIQNSDRSEKIRTYNYLQDRITDHRVKLDFSNINKFMQGEIKEILMKINIELSKEENEI